MIDPRVAAIREHPRVGRGSCTSVDECYSDADLITLFNDVETRITSAKAAIEWALESEELFREQGLNARWGEDDDPQLLAWQAWQDEKERRPE
jgi:hypothetical protein